MKTSLEGYCQEERLEMCNDKEIYEISYRIYCRDEGFSFSEDVTVELNASSKIFHAGCLHKVLLDSVQDLVEDHFIKIIDNAMEQFEVVPCGEFNWEHIIEKMQSEARAYVRKAAKSIHVYADECDSNGNVIKTSELDVEDHLLKSVDRRCEDENSACASGRYIQNSLFKFAERSQWQFGLMNDGAILYDPVDWPKPLQNNGVIIWGNGEKILQPIMWYGLPNQKPYKAWIAVPFDEEKGSIWFANDEWNTLGYVVDDADDYFLTWYFPECGYEIPDIDEIKEACPVHWDKNDTKADLSNKISQHMINVMPVSN